MPPTRSSTHSTGVPPQMTPTDALNKSPDNIVWRLAITGEPVRGKCTINLTPHQSTPYQHRVAKGAQVFADTGDPKHDWLWDIINMAKMGEHGRPVTQPPPTFIVWFLTTSDNKLLEFLHP